jgi:hypothetical protein
MSNIRIMGVLTGLALVGIALLYFRGPRWNRMSFIISAVVALALLVVSVDPSSVNILRDVFGFGQFEYGRIVGILILSNLSTVFLVIYTNGKIDELKHLIDRTMRAEALEMLCRPDTALPPNGIMIIIPALNEADNLKILLPQIPRQACGLPVGVLVVDDGSDDGTKDVAIANGCYLARLPINRGQGAALRVGYDVLLRENIRVGITMDADNQHKPRDIEKMVAPILSQKYDLVVGSRILGSSERENRTRYLGVILFSPLVSWLTRVKITDCSSGFRAFDTTKIARLDLRQDQYQSSEVLITAAKKGLLVGEVPIHIDRRLHGMSRKGTDLAYGLFFLKAMAKSWWR